MFALFDNSPTPVNELDGVEGINASVTTQVTGTAVPTATPEPASLTLLGGALAVFELVRRAKRLRRTA
jgi:PEP-CTERM motif